MKTEKQKSMKRQNNQSPESTREAAARQVLRNYYESTRRNDEHEPCWIHPCFEDVYSGAALEENHLTVADAIVEGKVVRFDQCGRQRVVDRDGWIVGTTMWIFFRRHLCTPMNHKGWTIINACFEGETYWMAYDPTYGVNVVPGTFDSIGPALDRDMIIAAVNQIEGEQDSNMAAAEAAKPASGITYYTLMVMMRDGKMEIRGLRIALDVRQLPAHEREGFVAWVARSAGISPPDTADLGTDPCAKLEAFDHEHQARAHLAWLIREFGPSVPKAAVLAKFVAYGDG